MKVHHTRNLIISMFLAITLMINPFMPAAVAYEEPIATEIQLSDEEDAISSPTPQADLPVASPGLTGEEPVPAPDPEGEELTEENAPITPTSASIAPMSAAVAGTLGQQALGAIVKIPVDGVATDFIVVWQGRPSSSYSSNFDGGTLLVARYVNSAYQSTWSGVSGSDYVSFLNSNQYTYLNNTYFNLIGADIRNHIRAVDIPAGNGAATNGVKVFTPSAAEFGFNVTVSGWYKLSTVAGLLSGSTVYSTPCGVAMPHITNTTYPDGTPATMRTRTVVENYYSYWNDSGGTTTWYPHYTGMSTSARGEQSPSFQVTHAGGNALVRPMFVLPNTMAVDGSGNVSAETPPTIPAGITVPASITYGQAYTVSWGASTSNGGAIASYILERQINGGGWVEIQRSAATSRSETLTRDQANTVRYRVKARSASGLESDWRTSDQRNVINNHAPGNVPSFATQPAAAVNAWDTSALTWTWNASSDADGDTINYIVERSVNGGAWTQAQNSTIRTYTHTIAKPGDTSAAVRVRARDSRSADSAGYLTSGTVSIVQDVTAAAMSIAASPDSSWTNGDVIITVTVQDDQSGLKSINVPAGLTTGQSTALSGASAAIQFTASQNGTYAFQVEDNAGNAGTGSITISNIDKGVPVMEHTTSVPAGEFTNSDVELSLTISNEFSGTSTFTSSAGTENISGNTVTKTFTITENGTYAFSAANETGSAVTREISINQIDRVLPEISMIPRVAQWTNATSVMLDVEASDDYSGLKHILLPDGAELAGESTAAFEITENGIYAAFAEDRAGNITPTGVDYRWFDRTPPAISSVRFEPKDKNILRRLARFLSVDAFITNEYISVIIEADDTPEGNEGESGVQFIHYRVFNDKGILVQNWEAAAYGENPEIGYEISGYIELYVEDAAGNVSDTETFHILIDITPPVVHITPSATNWVNTDITLTVSMQDNLSGLKSVTPSSGAAAGDTVELSGQYAEIPFTVSANGVYTFEAVDTAGNIQIASITVANIDKDPPAITITSSPARNEAVLSVYMEDSLSGLRHIAAPAGANTDASLILSGRSEEIQFKVVANGTYTFEVTDNAGNVETESVTVSSIGNNRRPSSRPNNPVNKDDAVIDDVVEYENDDLHDIYPSALPEISSDTCMNTVAIVHRTLDNQEIVDIECVCCGGTQDCTCGCLDIFLDTASIINPADIGLLDTSFNSGLAYEKLPVRDRTQIIINIIMLVLILLICALAFIIYLYNRDDERAEGGGP